MATKTLTIGSELPEFSLPGVDGDIYDNSSFERSNILVVIFSCNHCPYVQAYEDRIMALQEEYPHKKLQIIAISSNDAVNYPEDSFEAMAERSENRGFNFPYLFDESQEVAQKFGATHTPEVFAFDQHRKLFYHGKIDDNWQDESEVRTQYLKLAIDEVLDGLPVSVPETFSIGCTIKWKQN